MGYERSLEYGSLEVILLMDSLGLRHSDDVGFELLTS